MEADLKKAKEYLETFGCTCVLCKGEALFSSHCRGVKPLLELLESGRDFRGFCAADKVVGRATAFLYCLLGVRSVYARTLSMPAERVLASYGICAASDELVEGIRNRTNTGPCPMEAATADIDDPHEALAAIRATLETLRKA